MFNLGWVIKLEILYILLESTNNVVKYTQVHAIEHKYNWIMTN
jgi:hypothetical protein